MRVSNIGASAIRDAGHNTEYTVGPSSVIICMYYEQNSLQVVGVSPLIIHHFSLKLGMIYGG